MKRDRQTVTRGNIRRHLSKANRSMPCILIFKYTGVIKQIINKSQPNNKVLLNLFVDMFSIPYRYGNVFILNRYA